MPENDALQNKRFAKNDEGFFCAHCGKWVPPPGLMSTCSDQRQKGQ